jgi:hypothetical protein
MIFETTQFSLSQPVMPTHSVLGTEERDLFTGTSEPGQRPRGSPRPDAAGVEFLKENGGRASKNACERRP